MSRMTKFLRQKCQLERFIEIDGTPILNIFGEFQYAPPTVISCRHELSYQDVQTANGSIVRSTSRYFVDDSHPIKADYKIDGKVVISVKEYINSLGKSEGYEVYV